MRDWCSTDHDFKMFYRDKRLTGSEYVVKVSHSVVHKLILRISMTHLSDIRPSISGFGGTGRCTGVFIIKRALLVDGFMARSNSQAGLRLYWSFIVSAL